MKQYRVAVVGALGAVGTQMINTLEKRKFPVSELVPLDAEINIGKTVKFNGKDFKVQKAGAGAFTGVDFTLFAIGAEVSQILAPIAVKEGTLVIDNSSAWRMDPKVPLVVPEVNPEAAKKNNGLIANPNCSTIQMLVVAKPLHDAFGIKRIVVSTYQAVSGTGAPAIAELTEQAKAFAAGLPIKNSVYPRQILFNALPQIDDFLKDGYTKEEMKMVNETHKILDSKIKVSPTAIRIPVFRGHSESLNIETKKPVTAKEVRAVLSKAKGVKVMDNPSKLVYPTALDADGNYDVYVGRIREDHTVKNGINMWIVADNLLKGAALNAVQIAELFVKKR